MSNVVTKNRVGSTSKQTVDDYLGRWLELKKAAIADSTYSKYRRNLAYIREALDCKPIEDVSSEDIQELYSYLHEDKDLAASTVRTIHRTFHTAIQEGVDRNELDRLFTAHVAVPAQEHKEMTTLDKDEVHDLIDYLDPQCRSAHYHAAIYIALNTGLRMSEVLGLKWDDIIIDGGDGGHISVRRRITVVDGEHDEDKPKSSSSRRQVALSSKNCDWLRQYRQYQQNRVDSEYAITSIQGNWLWPSNLRGKLYDICDELYITDDLVFHDLRHTHATLLLQDDVPAKVIQERLGHASLSTTMDRYSHVTRVMQDDAVAKWDNII